jgi:hypothetical protein
VLQVGIECKPRVESTPHRAVLHSPDYLAQKSLALLYLLRMNSPRFKGPCQCSFAPMPHNLTGHRQYVLAAIMGHQPSL